MRVLGLLVVLVVITVACRSAEDAARDQLRARLKDATPLSHEERGRLMAEATDAISGRMVRIREPGGTRTLDERQRETVLGMLRDPATVYDQGLHGEGAAILRGVTGGATPAHAELDASQTLWIDLETFLPRRYEFAHSMPGFGDYAYDLTVDDP